jgi:hypothetical protein
MSGVIPLHAVDRVNLGVLKGYEQTSEKQFTVWTAHRIVRYERAWLAVILPHPPVLTLLYDVELRVTEHNVSYARSQLKG